jgi:signal transduction histidine kinase
MRLIPRKLFYLWMATTTLVFGCFPACAQAGDILQILIINSYDESTAPYLTLKNVFMLELQRQYSLPIAFRQFDLEARSGNEVARAELKAELLQNEFAASPPDLVVAIGPPAIGFWLEQRDPVFSNIPSIFVAADFAIAHLNFREGDAVVVTHYSFKEAVEDILYLMPETSHMVMITGASKDEEALADYTRAELEKEYPLISFEYTNRMNLTALWDRLGQLQPGSVVYFILYDSDVDGVQLNHYSGMPRIRASSSVPVFGPYDDQLGQGILGGRLIQLTQVGKEMAVTAQDVLHARPSGVLRKVIDLSQSTYDWQQLKAWGINRNQLPPGSIIRFKPPGIWEQYANWILLACFLFAAQALLISALLVQHRHRRRAEHASSQLGRRLISAQENERRVLARELHDDLSQRLARLAIDTSYVTANPGSEEAGEVLRNMRPELVRISKDVHDMSYRLHPSLINDLGLVAALQTECERMRRYTDSVIVEHIDEVRVKIPDDLALCIYRITQEALNNAVKYADAKTIEIMLKRENNMLILTVRDNGSGFDPRGIHEKPGLGLSSMRERAELAGGSFEMRSQPGKGTSLSAIVPLEGTAR